jgi:hypothetical protein
MLHSRNPWLNNNLLALRSETKPPKGIEKRWLHHTGHLNTRYNLLLLRMSLWSDAPHTHSTQKIVNLFLLADKPPITHGCDHTLIYI